MAQDVIKEPVFFVPELVVAAAHFLHGAADVDEMLEELGGDAFVYRIGARQFESDLHQVETEEAHPSRGIGLFKNGAAWKLLAAIDDGDVIEPEESAFEDVVALAVHPVHPPGEVHEQLVKTLFQEGGIGNAGALLLDFVHTPARPRVHWRIKIGEFPFVSWNLAVRMLELLEQEQPEIFLGELRVDESQRYTLKRQIPSRKPRELPLVGHGENAHGVQVAP